MLDITCIALDRIHPARIRCCGHKGDIVLPCPCPHLRSPLSGEVVLYDVDSLVWRISAPLTADELQPWSPPLVLLLRNTQALMIDIQAHVLIAYPLSPDMLCGHPVRVPLREYAHAAVRLETHRTYLVCTEHNRRVVLPVCQPVYALLASKFLPPAPHRSRCMCKEFAGDSVKYPLAFLANFTPAKMAKIRTAFPSDVKQAYHRFLQAAVSNVLIIFALLV